MSATSGSRDTSNVNSSHEDAWMIRPCEVYHDEHMECKSIKGRFHQRYTTGIDKDCSPWLKDYNTCMEYRHNRSLEFEIMHFYCNSVGGRLQERLVASAKERRQIRIDNAHNNDIWEYRKSPPEDWGKPLPPQLEKKRLPEVKDNGRCVIS